MSPRNPPQPAPKGGPHRLRRLAGMLSPQRGAMGAILVLAFAAAALNALEPLVLKRLFDGLEKGRASDRLILALAALGALGVAREASGAFSNWLTWRTRIRLHYALTQTTVGKLHQLPVSFHREESVGKLMTQLDRGIQGIVSALTELSFNVVPAVVYLLLALFIMFRLDWRLAAAVAALTPLPALIAHGAAPGQTRRERALFERWVRIYARFNEVLTGIVTVKSFAMEEREKGRFLGEVAEANGLVIRGVAIDSGVSAGQSFAAVLARLAALGLGGALVLRGEIGVGTLVAFLGYLGGVFSPLQSLSGVYRTLRVAAVSADQVFAILDAEDEVRDAPGAAEIAALRGDVEFRDVRFSYRRGGGAPLLDGINLKVRAGESVALVGPSGAGKSTLMALLQRFYDPDSGAVMVDGLDVREVKQASLRRHVGVVLQDALLFNDSVRANIAYGAPRASMAQIEAAARAAYAHDFILRLPQGYDTLVGERGNRLSAGERQRLAIARTLLKDSAVVILDEPTSALDIESEALVQRALSQLLRGRTTFVIAHRLSTVVHMDRILVLSQGRIVEQGDHRSLMALGGYYASLVRRQSDCLEGGGQSSPVADCA